MTVELEGSIVALPSNASSCELEWNGIFTFWCHTNLSELLQFCLPGFEYIDRSLENLLAACRSMSSLFYLNQLLRG